MFGKGLCALSVDAEVKYIVMPFAIDFGLSVFHSFISNNHGGLVRF